LIVIEANRSSIANYQLILAQLISLTAEGAGVIDPLQKLKKIILFIPF